MAVHTSAAAIALPLSELALLLAWARLTQACTTGHSSTLRLLHCTASVGVVILAVHCATANSTKAITQYLTVLHFLYCITVFHGITLLLLHHIALHCTT